MTNFEYWKDKILKYNKECEVGVVNNEPVPCTNIDCDICEIYLKGVGCKMTFVDWLYKEHNEKPTLTQKEWHLLNVLETGYIAKDSTASQYCGLYWYEHKPIKSYVDWSNDMNDGGYLALSNINMEDCFPFIIWEDKEPWKVQDLLKLEVRKDD